LEVLEAVGSGKLDMGTVYDSIHGEMDPRFYVVGNLPAGMTVDESMCWLVEDQWAEQGGGWQLAKELYAEHNCEWLFFSFGPPLMDYLSTKKIESNTDYKGVKVRATGLVAKVLQEPEFGAVVSDQAEADVYSALEKGDIEAAFLYGPEYNVGLNLHKVAKYAGFPGMQAQMRTTGLLMNSDKYIMLTEDIQNYLKWACQTFAIHTYAYKVMNDAGAWHEMKDAGIEMVTQNEDCQIAWEQASWRIMDDIAAKDAKFKKVWNLWRSMVRMLRPYMKMQLPNYEDIPGVEPKYG
jgi:TRAP-type mannitol/chloroaromatic compound transport system substrate-binding protein